MIRGALGVAGLSAVLLAAAGEHQQQVFRSEVRAVSVDVAVTTGSKPVTGLSIGDFALSDNGVPQTIQVVSAESQPLDVSVLIDTTVSVQGQLFARLQRALSALTKQLAARDRVRIITFAGTVRAIFEGGPGESAPAFTPPVASGTVLFDALAAAMTRPRNVERGHVIVAFTDGYDTGSFLDAPALVDLARSTDVPVYFVLARTMAPSSTVLMIKAGSQQQAEAMMQEAVQQASAYIAENFRILNRDNPLRLITTATGGEGVVVNAASFEESVFTRLLNQYRAGYILRYVPAGVAREGWHDLVVRVKRPASADVRARKGYDGSK